MGRSILKDPDKEASADLFGNTVRPVRLGELERKTGIARSTLAYYRKTPGKMSLERLGAIVRALNLTDEEIVKIVKRYRGKS